MLTYISFLFSGSQHGARCCELWSEIDQKHCVQGQKHSSESGLQSRDFQDYLIAEDKGKASKGNYCDNPLKSEDHPTEVEGRPQGDKDSPQYVPQSKLKRPNQNPLSSSTEI